MYKTFVDQFLFHCSVDTGESVVGTEKPFPGKVIYGHQDSVPRDLSMKYKFLPVVIDLDDRITRTEIGVQVIETDRHLHRGLCRNKPCGIYEQHGKPLF